MIDVGKVAAVVPCLASFFPHFFGPINMVNGQIRNLTFCKCLWW